MPGIKKKVVAITGASSGIGEATALRLAERGAKVVLGARRSDRLERLATRIAAAGGEVAHACTDVRRRGDLVDLVGLACARYGKLDVLVNHAGVAPISPLDELRVEEWEEMIDVNIKGVLYGIAAALPVFRQQGFGHFINTASTAGLKTVPNQSVYSATKFAVRAVSEGLRQEAGDKLRVTIISPGFVPDGPGGNRDESRSQGSARRVAEQLCDSTGRDRPRHRVRDRAAGRCRCRRDRCPSDRAGVRPGQSGGSGTNAPALSILAIHSACGSRTARSRAISSSMSYATRRIST